MALTTHELQERLVWLAGVIRQAGQIVLKYYGDHTAVQWKTPTEPVTAADHASNEFLVTEVQNHFPGEAILAEESRNDNGRLQKPLVWMIDPMDGTKEFISRNGEFSVMIGLVENGQPILGAVYQPTESRLFLGAKGIGATLAESDHLRALQVSERARIDSFRLVVSRSHLEPVVEDIRSKLAISDIRQSGSVGLKCGLIVCDECDLYIHPSPYAKLWDSCAPQAILEAAGGIMTDISGKPLDYLGANVKNENGILASNGKAHGQIVDMMREILEKR